MTSELTVLDGGQPDPAASRAPDRATTGFGPHGAAGPSADAFGMWRSSLRGWDAATWGMLGLSALSLFVSHDGTTQLATGLGLLALLGLGYQGIARPSLRRGRALGTVSYLGLLATGTSALIWLSSLGSLMLFLAYTHGWFFSKGRRGGAIFSAVLTVMVAVSLIARAERTGEPLASLLIALTISLAFSITLGFWVAWIAEKSEERARLIEELEVAQAALAESNHAAGVLAERARIAQEIHDTLAQGFTSIVMLSQTAGAQLGRGLVIEAGTRVDQIELVARENLAEARALVAAFGPASLADHTFCEALERLGHRFTDETGTVVVVQIGEGCANLGRDVEVVLLRAAQEALANVRKHAGARRVVIRLAGDGGSVWLEVTDNGRGIAADAVPGVGLTGMRERALAAGGTLELTARDEGGTMLRLTLPLPDTTGGEPPHPADGSATSTRLAGSVANPVDHASSDGVAALTGSSPSGRGAATQQPTGQREEPV